MEAFSPKPPQWTETAIHALKYECPCCHEAATEAQKVWLNRRAPVSMENYRHKWQTFYLCKCSQVWWAWNSDRPPSDLV